MEQGIKERLLLYIGSTRENTHQFEKRVNLSNGFVNNLKTIGSGAVEKIHYSNPQLNIMWLLFGEGNMLIDSEVVVENKTDKDALVESLNARIAEQANYIADLRHMLFDK